MSNEIRVIIADDSGLMRLIISDIINDEPGMKVIDTAANGKEAVEKTLSQDPDVLILDMTMEEYDGLYAVKNILSKKQVPILILSALGNTNMDPILEALRLGAFDYLNKPEKNKAKIRDIGMEIVNKVRAAAKTKKYNSPIKEVVIKKNTFEHTFARRLDYDAIVIGSSTGGPTAVETVVTQLPGNLPIPVFIAQHMPANFILSFVDRLDNISPLKVVVGEKDQQIKAGNIYLAPGTHNLIVKKDEVGRVVFDYDPNKYRDFNNPSVTALMNSVADVYGAKTIAIMLTGMGKDGADGFEKIFHKGGYTIAQNKETCVVYGMPREVVERNAARAVLGINEIPGFVVSCLS